MRAKMIKKELQLKVAEAIQDDVNKGIVRIDSSALQDIGIKPGAVVEIEDERITVAIADRAYPGDIGLNIIRMDGIIRKNCKTSIGEFIKVRPAQVKEAKKIVIAPARKDIMIKAASQIFKQGLLGRAVVKGDIVALGGTKRRRSSTSNNPFFDEVFTNLLDESFGFGSLGAFGDLKFIVAETNPKQSVIITDQTEIVLNPEAVEVKEEYVPEVSYEDVGGLSDEIKKVREMVELPLKHPEIFERLGIEPPKGVLFHGPPGTGKTLLVKAVANETNSHFVHINGPEIMSKFYGQSEENIRKKFEEAEKNAPSIIFIDEIDAIASKREETRGEVERRVVAQLLAMMDGLQSRGKVVVIAATNVPNILDPALRRPGRFDREIEIGVPSKKGRLDILKIHTRNMPLDKSVNLDELASLTHGFVGADLSSLSKESAMVVLRKVFPDLRFKEDEPISKEILENLRITRDDFMEALKTVRPSALREVLIEKPNVTWADIGGLSDVKQELIEAVEWPLKHPDSFKRLGVKPPKGILLYGAPGTGKTMLAKAVAKESEANFISVKGPELLCVSKDTPIFTNFCGVRPIEEFYNNLKPACKILKSTKDMEILRPTKKILTYAITEKGDLVKTRIKTVHKLMVDDCYDVELANNAKIIGSKNQPLLVYRNNNIQWVKLEDVRKGEFVSYPSSLKTFNKKVLLPFPKYKHILKVREDKDNYYARIFSAKQITKLPKIVTPQLASFLGWFVSEGSITKEGISICNFDKKNQKEIIELFTQFVDKDRITVYKGKVVVYSMVLIKYLEEILNQKLGTKKCYTIKCPNVISKANELIICSFLRSAYKGDGSISGTKIEYGSMSKNLVEGISYMLTLLGIKYRFWQRKDKMYMSTISGKKEMDIFKMKVFNIRIHDKAREDYNAQYIIPPIAELLKQIKNLIGLRYGKQIPDGSFEHAISGRRKTGLLRLQRIMKTFEKYSSEKVKKAQAYMTLSFISKGNVLWTRIISKKKAPSQVMYDVETSHDSFIGGNIPLLLHNSKWVGESEKAVREIFKKARQASPCVIFFDEIDSIAPERRASSDSHVTESVVNQLLTEMDGLVEMHDVVILAATNRPDIMDTALLRPGRFDRIILTPAPNEKGRMEIFRVHTKGMPIKYEQAGEQQQKKKSKGIPPKMASDEQAAEAQGQNKDSIEAVNGKDAFLFELAKKTEGYVGADIEAICREAAILALREDINAKEVAMSHFIKAMGKVRPSLNREIEETYKELKDHFSSAKARQMKEERPAYMG